MRRPSSSLVLAVAVLLGVAEAARAQEPLLVGVLIGTREVGVAEVLRQDGEFLVPLDDFAEWTGCEVRTEGGVSRLVTSLGSMVLESAGVREVEGVVYLRQSFMESRLVTGVTFDPADLTLKIEVPWKPITPALGPDTVKPDVKAPSVSLARVREDAAYVRQDGIERTTSSTLLGGRLAGGTWRVQYQDDFEGNPLLQEYAWSRRWGRTMLLAGRQQVQLHPLLNGIELTGAQLAWTNRPLAIYPESFEGRELLPRRLQPVATFRGPGPAGGLAELRIDGVIVARATVGLDGQYEFLEVQVPARQLSRIEVAVYDRQNFLVPLSIQQHEVNVAETLLPGGTVIHMGGAGAGGNLAQDVISGSDRDRQAAGFYQLRIGLSDGVTVEGGAQSLLGKTHGVAGLVMKVGPAGVLSLAAAGANGRTAYGLDFDYRTDRWRVSAVGQSKPRDYGNDGAARYEDGAIEGILRPSAGLEVGLIARHRVESGTTTEYVLPGINWRPLSGIILRAWPDLDGEYRYDVFARADRHTVVTVSHQDNTVADVTRQLGGGFQVSVGSEFGGSSATRFSAVLSRPGQHRLALDWRVGAIASGGKVGFLAGADYPLAGSVLLRAEYQSIALSRAEGTEPGSRVFVGLTADLSLAGRRVFPANTLVWNPDRGAIAGRVVLDGPGRLPPDSLYGLSILADGHEVAVTDQGGSFFVGNLREGVVRLELEADNLPIELVPVGKGITAQVVGGAVTRADLKVRLEYGLAGRLTDLAGRPAPGLRIEVVGAAGVAVASDTTDQFGLFRVDSVPAGIYTVRVVPDGAFPAGAVPPSRGVAVVDDFLFGQDLVLPFELAPGSPPAVVEPPPQP